MPNLSAMSVDALLKLRDDINKVLDRRAYELRSQLSMLGAQRRGPLKGRKVPPKYRSPSGWIWAGRGAKPKWLVAAIKRGMPKPNLSAMSVDALLKLRDDAQS